MKIQTLLLISITASLMLSLVATLASYHVISVSPSDSMILDAERRIELATLLDDRIMVILESTTISSPLHVPAGEFSSRFRILRNCFSNSDANLHVFRRGQKIKCEKHLMPPEENP